MPRSIDIQGQTYTTGDYITCFISGQYIDSARIYVSDNPNTIYICQNQCNGDHSPDKLGYVYSWVSFYKDGQLTDNVTGLCKFINCDKKETCNKSADFDRFLNISDLNFISTALIHKIGVFDEFTDFSISKSVGMIQLSNSNKKMELKFGRFLKRVSDKFKEVVSTSTIENSDKFIEEMHNKFVSFQANDQLKVEFLYGQDILKGYDPKNYLEAPIGTLHKSCMTNHGDWLKLYTENPKQIGLATISLNNKIAARGLVWIDKKGEKFIDRVYFTHEWLFNYLTDKIKELGYKTIDMHGEEKTIQLDKCDFTNYPYVDSFYLMDKKKKTLHCGANLQTRNYHVLRAANGNVSGYPVGEAPIRDGSFESIFYIPTPVVPTAEPTTGEITI